MQAEAPLYQVVKDYIIAGIKQKRWLEHGRVPSENELVTSCNVSRMTAKRALDELTEAGVLYRVQGRGTFVAPVKLASPLLEIRDIAAEIRERGAGYSNQMLLLQTEDCPAHLLEQFALSEGDKIHHTIIVHMEDEVPVQLEQRYVNCQAAPKYLQQNFEVTTPSAYLSEILPLTRGEHSVEARAADTFLQKTLRLVDEEPVLTIIRKTWSGDTPVSYAYLFHPATRYRLVGSVSTITSQIS